MTTEGIRIPVTILTGFLGAGKTTLLKRILSEPHGGRVAVIENEFGEEGIDNELLIESQEETIVEMNNGCICCTVRGDLVRILGQLLDRRDAGAVNFDRVIIETTGLADPAPVAQTFFVEPKIRDRFDLDAIITVVDAVHGAQQLDEHHEAQEQVGFADRILLSKTDLVSEESLTALSQRLAQMNPRAPIRRVHFGQTPIEEILDIKGFDLSAILDIEPDFLTDVSHEHDDEVSAFVYRTDRAFDQRKLEAVLGLLVEEFGTQMMRYKGVVWLKNETQRAILQGVHMLMAATLGRAWGESEKRASTLVFIGKNLPKEAFREAFDRCAA